MSKKIIGRYNVDTRLGTNSVSRLGTNGDGDGNGSGDEDRVIPILMYVNENKYAELGRFELVWKQVGMHNSPSV